MGLRKLFILMLFITTICYGQNRRYFREYIDLSKYEIVDSLPLERVFIYSPFDYESDKVIPTGDGTYLIEMPYKDKMIIRKNNDNTKAIVVYNSFIFGRHKEFNIEDSDRRLILWYEDEYVYCGYIYDKQYKVCKYFEQR